MKKIYMALAFIFLFPQQGYTKAMCPAGITQAECCAMDNNGGKFDVKRLPKQLFGNMFQHKCILRRLLYMQQHRNK